MTSLEQPHFSQGWPKAWSPTFSLQVTAEPKQMVSLRPPLIMGFHYSFRSWHGWGWEGQCGVFGWRCWPWSYTFVHLAVLAFFFSSRSFSASLWLAQSAFFHSLSASAFFSLSGTINYQSSFCWWSRKEAFPSSLLPFFKWMIASWFSCIPSINHQVTK